jgi:uncharacterized protein with NRDE domain
MCTIIIAQHRLAGLPLVVGHDRDELITRHWLPPARRRDLPHVLAPRDAQAGGTWIGANDAGLVVAITNRFGARLDDTLPTRGRLALRALTHETAADALDAIEAHLEKQPYRGFNLVLADARDVFVICRDGPLAERHHLGDGVHVVTSMHHVDSPETASLIGVLDRAARQGAETFGERLRHVLSDDTPLPSGVAVCKHLGRFGTVCGSIVWVGPTGPVRFEQTEGPPCRTPFADVPLDRTDDR